MIAALIAIGAFTASASASTSDTCTDSTGASRVTCEPPPVCGPIPKADASTQSVICPINPCSPESTFNGSRVPAVPACDQPCPPPEPVTDPATNVGGSSAILNGHVLSWGGDTHWYFAYGPDPANLPFTTPVMTVANGAQTLSAPVSGLSPGATYFQLVVFGCNTPQYGQVLSLGLANESATSTTPSASGDSAASTDTSAGVTESASSSGATASPMVVRQSVARVTAAKKTTKARKHAKHRKLKRAKRHS